MPRLQSIHVGRSDFWCSLYAFSQKQGLITNNGYKVYSESTKLTIPNGSCNEEDIQELRLDGYSKLEELMIGDNCFCNTNQVYIEEITGLKSITVGQGSFSNQDSLIQKQSNQSFQTVANVGFTDVLSLSLSSMIII